MSRSTKSTIALVFLVALVMIGLPVMFGVWMMWPVSVPTGPISPGQVSSIPVPGQKTPAPVAAAGPGQSPAVPIPDPPAKTLVADAALRKAMPMLQFRLVANPGGTADADVLIDPSSKQPILVQKKVELDERDVARAYTVAEKNETMVGLDFTEAGSARLSDLTAANIDRQLAVIFNGSIITVPTIRTRIRKSILIPFGSPGSSAQGAQAIIDSINARISPAIGK